MIVLGLAASAAAVLSACGSDFPHSGIPIETVSATGAPQCAVTYHSTGSGTAVAITTTVAGKLDISVAAVGGADEQTVATGPGIVHVNFREIALQTLSVTLQATDGTAYHCSVTPA